MGYREIEEASDGSLSVAIYQDPASPYSHITLDLRFEYISRNELVSTLEYEGINPDTFFAHYESL